mmetsp:Transcript_95240/g.218139  ORF Transcript_95240/g.218139 Transcript_95240/m.218139 type:complete len:377 (-) Transcript_95240:286-1416(-)
MGGGGSRAQPAADLDYTTLVCTCSHDGRMRVWDAEFSGAVLSEVEVSREAEVTAAAIFPSGDLVALAVADGSVQVVHVSGTRQAQCQAHTEAVKGLTVTSDGSTLASCSVDGTVRLWDASQLAVGGDLGQRLQTLEGHQGSVNGIAFFPDGERIVSASSDCTVRVWPTYSRQRLNPDERAAQRKRTKVLKNHASSVYCVAVFPDGTKFVSGSTDFTARVWDAKTFRTLQQLKGHSGPIRGLAIFPDSSRIVTGSWDGSAIIWDAGGKKKRIKEAEAPLGVSSMSTISSFDGSTDSDDWNRGGARVRHVLRGHSSYVYSVAVSPDGQKICTAGLDNTARVWNSSTGRVLFALKGHSDAVSCIQVFPTIGGPDAEISP